MGEHLQATYAIEFDVIAKKDYAVLAEKIESFDQLWEVHEWVLKKRPLECGQIHHKDSIYFKKFTLEYPEAAKMFIIYEIFANVVHIKRILLM